ncbi:hypothetical protein AciPR4_1630 [Terriglobus saanensis SP1PR4]|uniref:Uncharacterized protein n=1 Tax=Terriglobus saanensis (strain ATCC BAA-1853 / DSM 23119 / SP1PR4) TaxID=401053 RepID=E8V386_TERSS|nr:hypothetical protein AciPR4_1630 [Terriglobus saanensis SP1PR4]
MRDGQAITSGVDPHHGLVILKQTLVLVSWLLFINSGPNWRYQVDALIEEFFRGESGSGPGTRICHVLGGLDGSLRGQ